MAFSITDAGTELLERAAEAPSKLATQRIASDNAAIVQILIAMRAGAQLADHPNPGEAVITIHEGAATLTGQSGTSADLSAGETADVPQETHRLDADEDTIAVLTLVNRNRLAHTA
ncbi:hypothetical protein [Brevibacterium otitidis]|uniref:Cupin domain protein n=1 Tax=Brevibacterium otitidis TaxID=53364 RepID=A0ABV5WZ30_9MICO|nr:hypothetical protein GCM10023233_26600 [Brevibacterium otitidis]